MSQKVVISRIQHRRGLKENLPQPLLPGELALATDEGELWIGGDPNVAPWGVRVYDTSSIPTANNIVNNHIAEAEFDNTFTQANFNTLVSYLTNNPTPTVVLEPADILWDGLYHVFIIADEVGLNSIANILLAIQNVANPVAPKYVDGGALGVRNAPDDPFDPIDGVFFLGQLPGEANGLQGSNAALLINRYHGAGIVTTLSNIRVPTAGATVGQLVFRDITVNDTDAGFAWSADGTLSAESTIDNLTFVSGTGINIDLDPASKALRITNTSVAASLNLFTEVVVTDDDTGLTWAGLGTISATGNADSLTIVAGSGIELETDTANNALVINSLSAGAAFSTMSDGVNDAVAVGDDTFTFRTANDRLSLLVTENDLTYGDNLLLTLEEANIDHNALANYVANEHIDWTVDSGFEISLDNLDMLALKNAVIILDPDVFVNHANVEITGDLSITGGGNLTTSSTLSLVNDVLSPGNEFYYGTNGAGAKGWYALPTPPTVIDTFVGLTDTPANYTNEAGSVLYVNGTADGVAYAPLYVDIAGAEYIAGTLVYPDQVVLESSITVGAVGFEQNGIRLNGVNVPVRIKSSAFGQTASILCHQHSTTNHPQLLLARANSNSANHVAVTNGMSVGELVGAGWAAGTPGYIPVAHIDFEVDAIGTVSDTSMPGRLTFRTTPDGAVVPVDAMYIDSSQSIVVGAATGGAQGAGTINAEGVYVNGVEVLPQVVVNDSVHTGFVATETEFTLATTYITIAAQDETSFDGTGGNGTFVGGDGAGGTAYVAADTITLSDGTVITVDAVNGDDDVTEFTVTTASTSVFNTGATLTQTSTSGTGTDFSITTGANNEAVSDISTLPVTGFSFDIDAVSDVIFVDYSLNSGGDTAGTDNFTAVGTMKIVANANAEGGLATLIDDQTDVRDTAYTGAVGFEAAFVSGAPNEVQVRYSNTLTSDVNMRIVIRRWMSY